MYRLCMVVALASIAACGGILPPLKLAELALDRYLWG